MAKRKTGSVTAARKAVVDTVVQPVKESGGTLSRAVAGAVAGAVSGALIGAASGMRNSANRSGQRRGVPVERKRRGLD